MDLKEYTTAIEQYWEQAKYVIEQLKKAKKMHGWLINISRRAWINPSLLSKFLSWDRLPSLRTTMLLYAHLRPCNRLYNWYTEYQILDEVKSPNFWDIKT